MNAPLPANITLTQKLATRFAIEEGKLLQTLKATAFRQQGNAAISDEQMTALMIVAHEYGLNPFTKELFAYPDKHNGIVPVVSVDGWARIINDHGALDGIDFEYSDKWVTMKGAKNCPEWCKVIIRRKDRANPITVTEYLDEVFRELSYASPWQTHTKRLLRHKTLIQGARLAFGFSGIYDEDEAERILEARTIEGTATHVTVDQPKSKTNGTAEPKPTETKKEIPTGERKPITAGALNTIKAQLKNAALTDLDVKARFGHDADGVIIEGWTLEALSMDQVNDVLAFIRNPVGE